MEQKVKGVLIAVVLWTGLIMMGIGNANAAYVTMDIDKWNGPSGTVVCKDVKSCYIKVLAAESRGSTYYCNSIVIKRDGKVIWAKNYWAR
jgi:hypothetical protein